MIAISAEWNAAEVTKSVNQSASFGAIDSSVISAPPFATAAPPAPAEGIIPASARPRCAATTASAGRRVNKNAAADTRATPAARRRRAGVAVRVAALRAVETAQPIRLRAAAASECGNDVLLLPPPPLIAAVFLEATAEIAAAAAGGVTMSALPTALPSATAAAPAVPVSAPAPRTAARNRETAGHRTCTTFAAAFAGTENADQSAEKPSFFCPRADRLNDGRRVASRRPTPPHPAPLPTPTSPLPPQPWPPPALLLQCPIGSVVLATTAPATAENPRCCRLATATFVVAPAPARPVRPTGGIGTNACVPAGSRHAIVAAAAAARKKHDFVGEDARVRRRLLPLPLLQPLPMSRRYKWPSPGGAAVREQGIDAGGGRLTLLVDTGENLLMYELSQVG